jgi:hypothetical protein
MVGCAVSSSVAREKLFVSPAPQHSASMLVFNMTGWMYIERCRDGVRGWIPANITTEIESDHIRSKLNIKYLIIFLI